MKLGLTNSSGTITAVLAMIISVLASLGCVPGVADFTATCNIPWLPEQYLPYAIGLTGLTVFLSKLFRPGGEAEGVVGFLKSILRKLFGSTAVVVKPADNAPGVATTTDVAKS